MSQLSEKWCLPTLEEIGIYNPKHGKGLDDNLEVSFVPMPNVRDDEWNLDLSLTRKLGQVRKGYTHFSDGDVLFAKITPCMENGKAGVAKGLVNGIGCGSTELHVLRPLAGIEPKYIYSYLHQEKYRNSAKLNMTGTAGQLRVPSGYFKESIIPLAPLNEQHRIVEKLDRLLPKVQACQERLEKIPRTIKRFRQSVLDAAYSGRLTEDWRKEQNSEKNANELLAEISKKRAEWLRQQRDEGNREFTRTQKKLHDHTYEFPSDIELPKNWTWSSLLKACWLVVDCHNKTAPYQERGIPLIRTTNIKSGNLLLNEVKFVSSETYAFWSRRCPPETGDILFTREAPMGECAIIPSGVKLCMGQRMMLLRVFPELTSNTYVSFAIQDPKFQQRLGENAVGSGVKHLRVGDVERLVIPFPPLLEQREIVWRVEALFKLADQIEARYQKAKANVDKLTQSILAKAFRGELVPQDPNDESASVLLERIRAARNQTEGVMKRRKYGSNQSSKTYREEKRNSNKISA